MSVKAAPEVRAAEPKTPPARPLILQRKCACGGNAGLSGECESCAAQRFSLQRCSAQDSPASGVPNSVERTLASPGRALDADARTFMESRFGQDFGGVRIHDGAQAAASARDVDAHAYTVGQDIVFGEGQYRPGTEAGRQLLAHELAHTVQQAGLRRSGTTSLVDQGPEYRRLETEADRAAEAAMAGRRPVLQSSGHLWMARKGDTSSPQSASTEGKSTEEGNDKDPKGFTAIYKTSTYNRIFTLTTAELPVQMAGTQVTAKRATYEVDKLILPALKGPYALELCNKPYKPLKAEFEWNGGKPVPVGNISRDNTETLQRTWLSKHNYKAGKLADNRWKDIGGSAGFPRLLSGPTCEIDHIQELQVGSDNEKDNLQVLDKVDNGASGNLIQQQLRYLATAAFADAKKALGKKGTKRVELRFNKAVMPGSPKCSFCCQLGQRFNDPSITASSGAVLADYEVIILGKAATLKIPGDKSKSVPLAESPHAENRAVATSIKNMTLVSLERDAAGKGHYKIRASLDAKGLNLKPGTSGALVLSIGPDGTLLFPKGKLGAPVKFEYAKLSPGNFTSLSVDGAGVAAEGTIKPSVPFLPTLDVRLESGSFSVFKALDKSRLKPPFSGLRFTKAELALQLAPEFKPVGKLGFEIGPQGKPMADAELSITADDAGLAMVGTLNARIPGVDEAKGDITYRGNEWSGAILVESSRIKIPYVESGSLSVRIAPKTGIAVDGKVSLGLPGGNKAQVGLQRQQEKWLFIGGGTFKIPKLDDTQVHVIYDGETLTAKGKTGFTFHGLRGTLDPITYTAKKGEEGKVAGTGKLNVAKGRVTGAITVHLLPSGKFTGEGKVAVRISEKLTATVGVKVDENEKVRLAGEIRLELIELFRGVHGEKSLFDIEKNLPIPGASIPGVGGLMAKVGGGVMIGYGIGPGVLRNVFIEAALNPLEDNPEVDVGLGGRLEIPAHAKLSGYIKGGIALDVTIAEASGFLTVTVSLNLKGGLFAEFKGRYAKNRFVVDAHAEILAALILGLALDATVRAKLGVGALSAEKSKTWNLKHLDVPTGVDFKLRAPLHYASDEAFKPPTLDSLEFGPPPRIDPGDLLGRIFKAATSTDQETQGA